MANPTTNYGFVLPTPTDLVTDLPADFDVALQGVDTRLKALQPGTAAGDLAYSSATANTNVRLPIGTAGQVLGVVSGVPAWVTDASGMTNPMTTNGDLISGGASGAPQRLAVGTNGQVLTVVSGVPAYASPAGGGLKSYTLLNAGGTALTGATTITVSGISNQQSIFVRVVGASANSAARIGLRINGDTANNYGYQGISIAPNSSVGVMSATENNYPLALLANNTASTSFVGATILGTASASGFMRISASSSINPSGGSAGDNYITQGTYSSSAALTSVSLFSTNGNFDAGTLFVYGMAV